MTNIVISPLYLVKEREEDYSELKQASELCKRSFEKNMIGMDEFLLFQNDGQKFDTCVDMFFDVFKKTHELWKAGHNLFFTDIDALCIRPINVFGQFDKFMCFAITEGMKFEDEFPAYFYTGSRYFPKEIPESMWDLGFDFWKKRLEIKWNPFPIEYWDFEQYVYNKMFFSQLNMNEEYEDMWQYNCGFRQPWVKDANIVAFWASRKNNDFIQQMHKFVKKYNI